MLKRRKFTVKLHNEHSFYDWLRDGNYNWVAPEVTPEFFPLTRTKGCTVKLELVRCNDLGNEVSKSQVLDYINERQLMVANTRHLLAFGAAFPDVQRFRFVIALGSKTEINDKVHVLTLAGSEIARCVTTRLLDAKISWLASKYVFLCLVP